MVLFLLILNYFLYYFIFVLFYFIFMNLYFTVIHIFLLINCFILFIFYLILFLFYFTLFYFIFYFSIHICFILFFYFISFIFLFFFSFVTLHAFDVVVSWVFVLNFAHCSSVRRWHSAGISTPRLVVCSIGSSVARPLGLAWMNLVFVALHFVAAKCYLCAFMLRVLWYIYT